MLEVQRGHQAVHRPEQRRPPALLPLPVPEAAPAADDAVPERPGLAPGVTLRGPLESGFRDRQWLVERDGAFAQLPELLYRVAEHADGQRTLEEIAAAVSAATGRDVSADLVRLILRSKLIPHGLITGPGTAQTKPRRGRRALKLRFRFMDPQRLEPLMRPLQVLYVPLVLIPLLLLIVASRVWLYAMHGAAAQLGQAFTTPGMLPLAVAILIPAAAFHELGHATALRYGGGRVRGIGAGFYLVYPVFYTDVTDAYRLGRWARVRTDLGGFYFHLLFSLGLLGLYGLTGQSVFLVAVLLIDAEIVRQSLPFLRFDGYWTLADLVGIPDFYTLMGRFLRSVLPRRWRRGPGLPRLQGWVTAVFALFVLLAVPALGAFMLFLLTNLPHFAGTIWHALPLNGGAFLAALRAGDGLGMAAAGTQVLVLILTGAGLLVILCSLARDVLSLAGGVRRLAWRWLSRRVRSSRAGPRAVHALVVR